MRHALLMTLALSVALVAVGCGGGGAAKTPKETVLNMRDALKSNSESAFVACFDATEKQKKMLSSVFNGAQAMMDFQDAVEDAFGEEGAEKVMGAGQAFDALLEAGTDDLEVTEDGDKATVAVKGADDDPMELVRKDGKWFIVFDEEEPSDEELEQQTKMAEAMAKVFRDMAKKAGEDGMTPEKLNEEMNTAMAAVFADS